MDIMNSIQNFVSNLHMPVLLIIGITAFIAIFFGKSMKFLKLPSIIGFMIMGVLTGPSVFNLVSDELRETLSFLTEMALGFVAVSICLELSFTELKKQGKSIIFIILSESLISLYTFF